MRSRGSWGEYASTPDARQRPLLYACYRKVETAGGGLPYHKHSIIYGTPVLREREYVQECFLPCVLSASSSSSLLLLLLLLLLFCFFHFKPRCSTGRWGARTCWEQASRLGVPGHAPVQMHEPKFLADVFPRTARLVLRRGSDHICKCPLAHGLRGAHHRIIVGVAEKRY